MGGEVNVYEVAKYRPQYTKEVVNLVRQLMIEGYTYDDGGNELSRRAPAAIIVGTRFYSNVIRDIVKEEESLQILYEENRRQVRQATMKAVHTSGKALSGEELSEHRKLWFENDPSRREMYAENIKHRKGMEWRHSEGVLTDDGTKVFSTNEQNAHNWLRSQNVDFQYEVHLGQNRHADLLIGQMFVELDGIKGGRPPEYWANKYGSTPYIVILINPHDRHRKEKMLNELASICESQGYKVSR